MMPEQALRRIGRPAGNALRDAAKEGAEASTQRVGGHPPGPDEAGEALITDRVPFHAFQVCRGQQEFGRERIGGCLMLICVVLADPVVVMARDQMAELVGYIPVLAEPVASSAHGDDRP